MKRSPESRVMNFFATAVLGILAVSTLPGLLLSQGWLSLADDSMLGLLAVVAIRWYSSAWNRYRRSAMPLLFLLIGLTTKLVAISWAQVGQMARGVDVTCVAFLAGADVVFMWYYWSARPRL
jgi:hypothetical protein